MIWNFSILRTVRRLSQRVCGCVVSILRFNILQVSSVNFAGFIQLWSPAAVMLWFQRIPVNINFLFAPWTLHSALLTRAGRGPPGDASVCHPDGSAVRTPGGPGPDKGGLGQCLCGTARGPGAAGARGFLGAPQLGAELNSPLCLVELHTRTNPDSLTVVLSHQPHCTSELTLQPLEDDVTGTRCGSRWWASSPRIWSQVWLFSVKIIRGVVQSDDGWVRFTSLL